MTTRHTVGQTVRIWLSTGSMFYMRSKVEALAKCIKPEVITSSSLEMILRKVATIFPAQE